MAWVRYDDQFYANAKVTAVIAEDAGALALHVLANTWTNGQKRMGFIPKHQPGVLICDRSQGQTWAEVLTRHGLWHECGTECASCQEEYADLPPDSVGYVIHNAKVYRAPARERTTPGTAAELSEKRREAGRRGGQASAARRNGTNESKSKQNEASGQANQANQANTGSAPATAAAEEKRSGVTSRLTEGDFSRPAETQQDPQASQANGVSKTSKLLVAGVTPVPGSSSYEEELPEPKKNSRSDSPPSESESDGFLLDVPAKKPKPVCGSDEDPDFAAFWSAYPNKIGKPSGRAAWRKAMKAKVDPKLIIKAAEAFRDNPERRRRAKQFTPYPATWLNDERYLTPPDDDDDGYWLANDVEETTPQEFRTR